MIGWLIQRSRQAFNLLLLFLCSLFYITFFRVLAFRDDFTHSISSSSGVKFAFEEYKLLDFFFSWPLILILSLSLIWLIREQLSEESTINHKLKVSALCLFLFFLAWLGFLFCLYYPMMGQLDYAR